MSKIASKTFEAEKTSSGYRIGKIGTDMILGFYSKAASLSDASFITTAIGQRHYTPAELRELADFIEHLEKL